MIFGSADILPSVTDALGEEALAAIIARDDATNDGWSQPDYLCAQDRHVLLLELNRMRAVVQRLQAARPVGQPEGAPWLSVS